jgi:hypothetical protein
MWFRIAGLCAIIGIVMSLRSELSNVAARTALATLAGGLVRVIWVIMAGSRAARERRGLS